MFERDDPFFNALRSIVKKMHRLGDQAMIRFGLSHAEMRILLLLFMEDECSQYSIAARQSIDRSNVGRSLKKLEAAGLITRTKDSKDRRYYVVRLTPKGISVKPEILAIKADIEGIVSRSVTTEDYAKASRILEAMDDKIP